MTKATIKQDESIRTIQKKIIEMQTFSMKSNIIISGIIEQKGEDCKALASSFFKNRLKIEKTIAIVAAHHIGKPDTDKRRLLVKLLDPGDTASIFKNSNKLKDQTNANGDNFYVNNQLPEKLEEE